MNVEVRYSQNQVTLRKLLTLSSDKQGYLQNQSVSRYMVILMYCFLEQVYMLLTSIRN